MRIVVVTDAWHPQTNGVVRTLETVGAELTALGHDVHYLTPEHFSSIPCPTYPEIPLCYNVRRRLTRSIDALRPCAIHIATEGPLGLAARAYCRRQKLPFSSAYHTRFPEYLAARFRIPPRWTYALLRWFHNAAARTMVATPSLRQELERRGFKHLSLWTRGVDLQLFRPGDKSSLTLPRPIHLYVGRVAVEKNIEAFLRLPLPGSKLVVGGGPQLDQLKARYPAAHFLGAKYGEELAGYYRACDVLVFPSRTDTFGLVLLEALASGLPVAAYPVTGPKDVLDGLPARGLDEDLGRAVRQALDVPPAACRAHAERYSWRASAEQFICNLQPIGRALT